MTTRIQALRSSITQNAPAAGTRLPGELWTNFPDLQIGVIDASKNAQKLVAVRYFSATANYNTGDFVVQAGVLYAAKGAITAGAFNSTQWTRIGAATDAGGPYLAITGGTLTGALTLNADPGVALGAATKQYVDGKVVAAPYLPIAGGTLTGPVILSGPPTIPLHAATKAYVDAGAFVPIGGGTMTGALTISGAAGTTRALRGATVGSARWTMSLGNNVAEGGSNTGSDFGLTAYADDGSTVIGTPLLITRSTMVATFGGSLTCVSAKFNADPNFAIGGVGAENVFTLGSGYFLGYNRATGLLRWVTTGNTIQAMTIDAPGNLVISGTATKPGGGSWAAPSDARIKIVEGDYKGGLDEVIKLAPVVYRYKNNTADPNAGLTASEARAEGPQLVGLVAQAVETVMPEMVTSGPGFIDGVEVDDLRTLDTTPLIFALVNAVKTLAARVAELEGAV